MQLSFLGRSITIRVGHNECHYMVVPYLECPLSSSKCLLGMEFEPRDVVMDSWSRQCSHNCIETLFDVAVCM